MRKTKAAQYEANRRARKRQRGLVYLTGWVSAAERDCIKTWLDLRRAGRDVSLDEVYRNTRE